jgi:sterol desaturase/sphingolipid hydroxylase (fatty acid hydroxylase superfamily)
LQADVFITGLGKFFPGEPITNDEMEDYLGPTLVLFPLVSLTLNTLGHLNHDLAPAAGRWHPLAGSRRHERHHRLVHGNYGFLLPLLDIALETELG